MGIVGIISLSAYIDLYGALFSLHLTIPLSFFSVKSILLGSIPFSSPIPIFPIITSSSRYEFSI